MKTHLQIFTFLPFLAFIVFTSCNNKPTEQETLEAINLKEYFSKVETEKFDFTITRPQGYNMFFEKNLATIQELDWHFLQKPYVKIKLTDEGKKYLVGNIQYEKQKNPESPFAAPPDYFEYGNMKVCDKTIDRIVVGRKDKKRDGYSVQFYLKYNNITPFGEYCVIKTNEVIAANTKDVYKGMGSTIDRYSTGYNLPWDKFQNGMYEKSCSGVIKFDKENEKWELTSYNAK